jgi:hypothetical protein
MSQDVRTETGLKKTRTGQIWNTLFFKKSWVYCPVLNTQPSVLKWERLGAYSDVRIQITMSKREREREREREKKTFGTQHGTNEERQN